jgi:uncharacterized membrane protein YeaQ/YmgE (transglycosylase-associated protein family)
MVGTFYVSGGWHGTGTARSPDERKESDMNWLAWIVLGLIAGGIAKMLMPGRDPGGCIVTILIGIVGALLGGWLSTLLGFGGVVGGLDWRSLVTAVLGSIILLAILRLLRGGPRRR